MKTVAKLPRCNACGAQVAVRFISREQPTPPSDFAVLVKCTCGAETGWMPCALDGFTFDPSESGDHVEFHGFSVKLTPGKA